MEILGPPEAQNGLNQSTQFIDGPLPKDEYVTLISRVEMYMQGFSYGFGQPLLEYTGIPILQHDRLILPDFYGRNTARNLYWCGYQSKLLGDVLSHEFPSVYVYFAAGTFSPFFLREEPPSHAWLMVSGVDLFDYQSGHYDLGGKPSVVIDPALQKIEPYGTNGKYKPTLVVPIDTAYGDLGMSHSPDEILIDHASLPLMVSDKGLIGVRLIRSYKDFALGVHIVKTNGQPYILEEFMKISKNGKNIQLEEHIDMGVPDNLKEALVRLVQDTRVQLITFV